MALITCPECGREKVSDMAEACPSCGFNIRVYFDQYYSNEYACDMDYYDEYDENEDEIIENRYDRKVPRIVRRLYGKLTVSSILWKIIGAIQVIPITIILLLAFGRDTSVGMIFLFALFVPLAFAIYALKIGISNGSYRNTLLNEYLDIDIVTDYGLGFFNITDNIILLFYGIVMIWFGNYIGFISWVFIGLGILTIVASVYEFWSVNMYVSQYKYEFDEL